MLIKDIVSKGLIEPPSFLQDNTHYIAIIGSQTYGSVTR